MRKLYTFLACLFFFNLQLIAQQITITGTSNFQTSNVYGPFNTDAGDNSNRHAYIYSASLFSAMPSGALISTIGFERGGTSTSVVDPGAILKIYLANTSTTDFGTADLPWSSAIASATLVYNGDPSSIIGNAAGWKDFVLSSPFTYTGNNIAVYVEYVQTGLSAVIYWVYNATAGQPAYTTNQTKYSNSTTVTPPATLTSEDDRHPNLQITYSTGSCTNPATAGQAVSNASATGVCSGAAVELNLTGNSTGGGQTYKWQSSSSQFGTYVDISPESSSPSLNVNPASTTWYKAVVKCGAAGTPVTSVETSVLVNGPLPAGTYTINNTQPTAGTNFQSFTDAIRRINCGVAGNVIMEVSAGQTFNATHDITVSGSAAATIVFRKSGVGANPKISKSGTSATTDYLLKLAGADFVTFDGIDFEQTGTSAADFVEYGLYIVNASATNGSQNNAFKNGVISLGYTATTARCVFIDAVATPTSIAGTNSFNKFLNMKVQNSFAGYYFTGASSTYPDDENQITTEGGGISQIANLGNGSTSGTIYGVYGTYQSNLLISNTDIGNFLGAGTSTIYGHYFVNSAANSITFSNNHIHDFTGGGTVYGFYMSAGSDLNFNNNHIHAIRSTTAAASTVRGLDIAGSTGFECGIFNNRIYDISSTGLTTTSAAGIETGAGTTFNIHHNMISDLRAGASTTTTGGVKGISITTTTAGSVARLYYNSVYLNDIGSVAGYTSAALHNASSTPTLDVRNNLFVNNSDVTSGTRAVAFWKSNTTINLDINTNNNLYYAGTPGSKNLIYYDGTNSIQLLNDYKTLTGVSPREERSVTENIALQTITSGIIRINPNIPSQAESGGIEITGYSVDFEGTMRGPYPLAGQVNGAGIKPDIGADEYDGRTLDVSGPTFDYVLFSNTSSTTNRNITVTITDPSVVRTGANGPRLYYRKSGTSTYSFDNTPTISGNQYTFTVDNALMGGVAGGDVIEYYFAAEDMNGYSATSPFGGSGINPPGTTAPATPALYKILHSLSGNYTIGATGQYANLSAVATLLNAASHEVVGNTVFELQADYDGSAGETFPIQFNPFIKNNPNLTLTFRPAAGVTARITAGDAGTTNALINLNGVSRIIFDGRPGGLGTANEWLFRNTRTATTIGSVFRLINDATNDTLRYLTIEGQPTATTTGLVLISTSTGTAGNSFNQIANNIIRGRTDVAGSVMSNGIYASGTEAAPNHDNSILANHIVNSNNNGISISATGTGNNWTISDNHIYGQSVSTVTQNGILFASDASSNIAIGGNFVGGNLPNASGLLTNNGNVAVTGINITGGVVKAFNNTIANISNINTGASVRVRGIYHTGANDNVEITGNTIFNLATLSSGTGLGAGAQVAVGIGIWPGSTFYYSTITDNIIYNISAENTAALATSNMAAGVFLTNFEGVFARNRIYDIKNKSTGTTAGQPPIAAGIYARFVDDGYVINNMISIGQNETNNVQFNGIMINANGTGNNHYYYYNTVHVSGNSNGDFSSHAFMRGDNSSVTPVQGIDVRNNIFYMLRTGGTAANFAIASQGATPGTDWSSNYNNLYNADITKAGFWNATGYDLSGWQNASGQDANSKTASAEFINPVIADLHLTGASVGNQLLAGTPIAGINVDFDLQARSSSRPYMGADEASITLPVKLEYFKGFKQGNVHELIWRGQCSGLQNRFIVERSGDAKNFIAIGEVNVGANGCNDVLSLTDKNPLKGINYYRLKIVDEQSRISYSIIIAILNKETGFEIVSAYPTPANSNLYLNVSSARKTLLNITIADAYGRIVQKRSNEVMPGSGLISVDVNNLSAGTYWIRCITPEGFDETKTFVKQ